MNHLQSYQRNAIVSGSQKHTHKAWLYQCTAFSFILLLHWFLTGVYLMRVTYSLQPLLRTMLYKYIYLLVCQFGGGYGPETLRWLLV